MRQLRASRTTYLAAAGVAGVALAETKADSEQVSDASNPQVSENEGAPDGDDSSVNIEQVHKRVFEMDLPVKLPIYPRPSPTLVLLDTPSSLELRIGEVRRELCGHYAGARAHVQGVIDRWIHIENMVESRIKSFRDPTEPLNPGLLYTGVSALTASVFARSRSLPTRFLLPPLSFLGAFIYFLPRTAGRVGSYVEEIEDRYAPRLGEVRRTGVAHTAMALDKIQESTKGGKDALATGARSVIEAIESGTGLKLGDVVGRVKNGGKDTSGPDGDKEA
ncbi:hypothetical protein ID866_3992 [Astraeus odoratus]|nr:hypothetical protein ID866_3992 [Astraeus odoratus]